MLDEMVILPVRGQPCLYILWEMGKNDSDCPIPMVLDHGTSIHVTHMLTCTYVVAGATDEPWTAKACRRSVDVSNQVEA